MSVALAPYPTATDGRADAQADRHMSALMGAIGSARAARAEHDVKPSAKVPLRLRTASEEIRGVLTEHAALIEFLVRTDGAPVVEAPGGERPRGSVLSVAGDVEVLVGLLGLVDAAHELERVERSLKKLEKDIVGLEKRLANKGFVDKAPPEVVAEAREQLEGLKRQKARLEEARELAKEL